MQLNRFKRKEATTDFTEMFPAYDLDKMGPTSTSSFVNLSPVWAVIFIILQWWLSAMQIFLKYPIIFLPLWTRSFTDAK